MPGLSFTLPHWLYWVGLIVFPLVAMYLSRRPQPNHKTYSLSLGYMILVTGGMIGLHRFYLKNKLGLIFLPLFIFILYSNSQEQSARTILSNYANEVRVAERMLEREEGRVAEAEANLDAMRATLAEAEEGSFAQTSAQRRLDRAEEAIATGQERIAEARTTVERAGPLEAEAAETRAFWNNAAGYSFYIILALLLIDAILLPGMIRRANAALPAEEEITDAERALRAAEAEEGPKHDSEYATNWIDRLSLFCGEFVAYWAVIAVFVY
jgi:hypothetical protein